MEFSDVVVQKLTAPLTALLGACVGGMFTLVATNRVMHMDNEKEIRREEKEVQNLLDAIGMEIGTLWDFHQRRIGAIIEVLPEGKALEFYYPLTQDYFTIYNSNATMIGRVKDASLREAIVVCYNKCKKVVDGFKYNNMLFRDYRDLLLMPADSPNHVEYVKAKHNELFEFAQVIKEDHFEVKGYVERLLYLLNNRAASSDS